MCTIYYRQILLVPSYDDENGICNVMDPIKINKKKANVGCTVYI